MSTGNPTMNQRHNQHSGPDGIISKIGHREEGFSMISAIMALMVGTLLSLAAWATAQSDINFTDKDKWSRLAYQRAQSGISDYVQSVSEDSGFWKACDRPAGVSGDGIGDTALNDNDFGAADHPTRRWLPMSTAGSTDDLSYNTQYTIDLQPLTGSCKPVASSFERMINSSTGTFKIAVTGRAGPLVPADLTGTAIESWRQNNWKRVTLVAEFRRNGFLDYAYFTDHEGKDPNLQSPTRKCSGYYDDMLGWAGDLSATEAPFPGRFRDTCVEIMFANGDRINGPFHTNDSLLLQSAGGPRFGSNGRGDRVEVYNNGKKHPTLNRGKCPFRTGTGLNSPSGTVTGNCLWNPNLGTSTSLITGPDANSLDLPEDNADLVFYAEPVNDGQSYWGKTKIELNDDGTYWLTNQVETGASRVLRNYPDSGVIYVFNNGVSLCQSDPYNKRYDLSIPAGCALAEVQGDYNKSLTIGSESDIVLTGNVERSNSPTAALGLIANQYVRIRHYSQIGGNYRNGSGGSCTSDGVTGTRVSRIEAAVLTLNRSVTVDGYDCGSNLGYLTTVGAIAQRWRGIVGQGASSSGSSCSGGTGYCKDYNYDYTLKSQAPPHFLSPSSAKWKIIRQRQVLPPCACKPNG